MPSYLKRTKSETIDKKIVKYLVLRRETKCPTWGKHSVRYVKLVQIPVSTGFSSGKSGL